MRHKLSNILKVLFTVMLVLSLGCFIACGGNNKEEKLKVKFNVAEDAEVVGYINTEFDVGTILVKQEGVTYTMKAVYMYFDDEVDEERELVCDELKFTQDKGLFDVYVTVTATKGDKTATGDITIIIQPIADYLDERLMGNWADSSYAKSINNDITYIRDGQSSIKYAFSGATHYDCDGAIWTIVHGDGSYKGTYEWQTFEPTDGFAATVTDWSTASLVMWVYNPMDEPIEFFNHLCNVTNGKKKINIDWGKEDVSYLVKTVPAHSWKLVRFELADHGITTAMQYEEYYPLDAEHSPDGYSHYHEGGFDLLSNPPVIGTDFTAMKSRYVGQPEEGFYAYHFYVDGFAYVDKDVADAMDPDYEPVVNPNPPKPELPDGQYYIEKDYVIRFEDYDETQPAYLEFDLEISADGADKFWTMLYKDSGNTVGPYKFMKSGVVENPPTPGISRGAYVTSNNEGVLHVVFDLDEAAGESGVKFIGMSDYKSWSTGADGIISNITISNVRPDINPNPPKPELPDGQYYIERDYVVSFEDYDYEQPAYLEFDLEISADGADKFWIILNGSDGETVGPYKFMKSGVVENPPTPGISRGAYVTSNNEGVLHVVFDLDEAAGESGVQFVSMSDYQSWCNEADGIISNITISNVKPEGIPEEGGEEEPEEGVYPLAGRYSIDLTDYDETKPAWLEFDLKIESTGADKCWMQLVQDGSNYFGSYKFTRSGIATNDATAGAIQVTSNDGDGLLHVVIALNELTTKTGEPTKVIKITDDRDWTSNVNGYITNIAITDVNPLA